MKNYIAENISYLVKQANCSQDDFGAMFDLKRGAVNQYIIGRNLPKIETIQKICNHYNLLIDDFINLELSTKGLSTNKAVKVINEPSVEYQSKDAIIEAQRETIDTQKELIKNLKEQLANAS